MATISQLPQGVLSSNIDSPENVDIQRFEGRPKIFGAIKNPSFDSLQSTKRRLRSVDLVVEPQKHVDSPTTKVIKEIEKVKSDLSNEVAHVSDKLLAMRENSTATQIHLSAKALEEKLTQLTEQRLSHLERLQAQQTQWQVQLLQTVEKVNSIQSNLHEGKKSSIHLQQQPNQYPHLNHNEKNELLTTPLPRQYPPQPSNTVQTAANEHRPGNGKFLQDILDQSGLSRFESPHKGNSTVDSTPIARESQRYTSEPGKKLPDPTIPQKIVSNNNSYEDQLKKLKNEEDLVEISKNFPSSISLYMPTSLPLLPSAPNVLETAPSGPSVVDEFRKKLAKLDELRKNLEGNTFAIERNTAQFQFDSYPNVGQNVLDQNKPESEKLRIAKLVNEQIKSSALNVANKPMVDEKPTKLPQPKNLRAKRLNAKPVGKVQKRMPKEKEIIDEENVTHVYGKAVYHPRRTTVHSPFMHSTSPYKQPTFRTHRALQTVSANQVKSQKTQTVTEKSQRKSWKPDIKFSGNRFPVQAIQLQPPTVVETGPIYITSPKKVIPVSVVPAKKPKKKVLSPIVPSVSLNDDLPGNSTIQSMTDTEEKEDSYTSPVEFSGQGNTPRPQPPCPPCKKKPAVKLPSSEDIARKVKQLTLEEQTAAFVEQELMARILCQVCPTVHCDRQPEESSCASDFPVIIDTGNGFPREKLEGIVENEILETIRRITQNYVADMPSTSCVPAKVDLLPPRVDFSPPLSAHYQPKTPLSTPKPTPSPSIAEESFDFKDIKTPSLSDKYSSPEPSVLSEHHTTPPVSIQQEIEPVHVVTPQQTPPPTPEPQPPIVEAKPPRSKSPESKPPSLVDPWEGRPMDEMENNFEDFGIRVTELPEPEAEQLVVRTITPEPKEVESFIESVSTETPSTSEFTEQDNTISDGQLIISHGEYKGRKMGVANMDGISLNENSLEDTMKYAEMLIQNKDNDFDDDVISVNHGSPGSISNSISENSPRNSSNSEASVGQFSKKPTKMKKFQKWKLSHSRDEGRKSESDIDVSSISENPPQMKHQIIKVASVDDFEGPGPSNFAQVSTNYEEKYSTLNSDMLKDSLEDNTRTRNYGRN